MPVKCIKNLKGTLKRTDKMVISYAYIFHYGRTEMQAFITDVVDMVVTEIWRCYVVPKFLMSSCDL
jgi:hypothetical protein